MGGAMEEQRRENARAWGRIDGLEDGRSAGEDAEWDRVRVEEDPELWDAAVREKAERELPVEVEPCLERIQCAGGENLGSACQPGWNGYMGRWECRTCERVVLIMREVKDGS